MKTTAEPLSDVPVLVHLTENRIDFTNVAANGDDLRFVTRDGAELAYEIDQWRSSQAWVWVAVPELPTDVGEVPVYLYFGNPEASPASSPADVWTNGYAAVWHLTTEADSSATGATLQIGEIPITEGVVATARQLDQTGPGIHVVDPQLLANVFSEGGTLSAWMRPSGFGQQEQGRLFDRSIAFAAFGGWVFNVDNFVGSGHTESNTLRFIRAFEGGRNRWEAQSDIVELGVWQRVSVVYDERDATNEPMFYVDGTSYPAAASSLGADPSSQAASDADSPMAIGHIPHEGGETRGFDGLLDELRVSRVPRSETWIQYQVEAANDKVIVYDPPETLPD